MSRALVLAAHGSRRDPRANRLVRRLAEAVRSRRLFDEVAVAFHQGEPGFGSALDELTADEVTIVPLLTSAGHYADVVLPQALSRNRRYNELRVRLTPPVGTDSGIAPLVARRITQLLNYEDILRQRVSLAIVGHGTPRHPESRTATMKLAETLRRRRVAGEVMAAFLDDDPPLGSLVDIASHPYLVVVPFLIGGGDHVKDIRRALKHMRSQLATHESGPSSLLIDHPLGSYPELVDIIIDLARRHAPPPAPRFRPRGGRPRREVGTVHLVGAGPGDAGLITARGLDLLRSADVVVHDRLIAAELLAEPSADAVLIDVGKGPGHSPYSQSQINALLVEHAREGRRVIRLKGGDPYVFGRGSEEMEACRQAGVPVEVIPGVSSVIAGPAAAGIPLTARGVSSSFTVLTGRTAEEPGTPSALSAAGDTIVLLMSHENLASMAQRLIAAGRNASTPAACIQSATTPAQRITRGTLGTIAEAVERDGLTAPVVTVIGEVARESAAGSSSPIRGGVSGQASQGRADAALIAVVG